MSMGQNAEYSQLSNLLRALPRGWEVEHPVSPRVFWSLLTTAPTGIFYITNLNATSDIYMAHFGGV